MSKIKKSLFSRFFSKLSIAIVIGMIPAIWVIQNDKKTQLFAKSKLIEILQREWNSKIDIESSSFNIFTGHVFLNKGRVISCRTDNFSEWNFKRAKVRFSRWDYFFNNKLVLKIKFFDITVVTIFKKNNLDLSDHLKDIFAPSKQFDVNIKSLHINNLKLNILPNKNNNYYFSKVSSIFHGDFLINKVVDEGQKLWHGSLSLKNGSVIVDGVKIFNDIKGISYFCEQNNFSNRLDLKIDKKFKLVNKENSLDCYLIVEWNNKKKFFELKSKDDSIFLKSDIFSGNLKGKFPFEKVIQIYFMFNQQFLPDSYFTGTCNLDVKFDLEKDFQPKGNIKIDDLKCDKFFCNDCNIDFNYKKNVISGSFDFKQVASDYFNADVMITGSGSFDIDKVIGRLLLYNLKPININFQDGFLISEKGFLLDVRFDSKLNFTGKYSLLFCEKNSRKEYLFKGNYFLKDKELKLSGKTFQSSYLLEGIFENKFCLNKFLSFSSGKKLVEIIKDDKKDCFIGKIRYSFLRNFLPESLRKTVLGRNSILYFNLKQNEDGNFKGSAFSGGGKLSFLGSYNPVEKFRFDFCVDSLVKKIFLKNFFVKFFKGSVKSLRSSIILDNNYNVNFIHFPLRIDDLLINWKSDFYSLLYGNALLMKKATSDEPHHREFKVFGDLVLKKSLFKESIFLILDRHHSFCSFIPFEPIDFQQMPIEFEMKLSTQNSIKAKTSSLDVLADLDLNLNFLYFNNKLQMSNITGSVDLKRGRLKFLYHNLFIEHGKIQFLPNQMNDPIIDFVAKNKIRKYFISLHATGLLETPNIILESSPELTEEEILALLIAGSENASFRTDLPAILMQNLNNLIVGSKNILPESKGMFEILTFPFKYVQITPDFTSHFGRGGIKGTLAIDLSKQLHAQIQKNFNLQDDLGVQVEYFLTDDINFKIVKDQRGEVGSEVEVSLRF
ncbi:translocation/assembly module TamB domain-containing protein [Candidatus Babeliales bacterium]|nr:translocation/assembly module TamB domain-containing protein [Candidatus Babeliales bacterium]